MKRTFGLAAAAIAAAAATACAAPGRSAGPVAFRSDRVTVVAPGVAPGEALRIAREAGTALGLYERALDVRLPELLVELHPDREAYAAAGGRGEGMYFPDQGRVLIFASGNPHVLRHEIAHHAAVQVVGILPPWLNEGIAEYLETIREEDGRAVVSGLAPHHLAAMLAGERSKPVHEGFHFHPVDYARAWALVAWLIEESPGTLAQRLASLRRFADATTGELERRWRTEWRLPERWRAELEEQAAAGQRAAIRVLRLLVPGSPGVQSVAKELILLP